MQNNLDFTMGSLYIEVTSRCNLRCKHCYNASGEPDCTLPLPLLQKVIEEAAGFGCTYISLSGGEPFLYPNIWPLADFLQERGLAFSIITNATQLNHAVNEKLKRYACSLQISLDGPDAETHNAVRGDGVFEQAVHNVKALRQSGFQGGIVIKGVLTRYMPQETLDAYRKLAVKIGASKVEFGWMERTGRAKLNYDALFLGKENLLDYMETINRNANRDQTDMLTDFGYTDKCPLAYIEENPVQIAPKITFHGDVYSCQMFTQPEFALGNIYRMTLSECIRGERFREFLDLLALRKDFMPECTQCVYKNHCFRGCPALGANQGSIFSCDEFCGIRKKQNTENILNAVRSQVVNK